MRPKNILLFALTILVLSSTIAAAQTTITFYDPRQAPAFMDQIVAEFEAANPDIKVEHVHINGYNQMNEKTLVAWAGGAAPNVVIIEQSRWFGFALDNMFLPLDDFIAGDSSIDMDDLYPGIREHLTWDGKLWGLPYNISTPLIYYNRDLFRMSGLEPDAPTTWDGILETSRRIARDTDGDGANDVWGIDFYNWGWLFEAWLGQNGARLASEDGRSYTFNSEEAIEAMEFVQSLVLEHDVAWFGSNGYAHLWAGRLGMGERSTASLANNVNTANENGIDLWVAPLACNTECYAPIGGGNLHILNTGTPEQREAAWRFVSFLTDTENLARMSAATGYMAGRTSSVQSHVLQDHFIDEPRALVTYQQLVHASPRAKVPNWAGEMASAVSAFTGRQFSGANVREELNELVRLGNTLLDEWYAARDARMGGNE